MEKSDADIREYWFDIQVKTDAGCSTTSQDNYLACCCGSFDTSTQNDTDATGYCQVQFTQKAPDGPCQDIPVGAWFDDEELGGPFKYERLDECNKRGWKSYCKFEDQGAVKYRISEKLVPKLNLL